MQQTQVDKTFETSSRTRTVSWEDPVAAAATTIQEQSGLEIMREMIAGSYPQGPIQELVGFDLIEISEGSATFQLEPAEYLYSPMIGSVHGGIAGLLLDSAMGASVHSTLPAGVGYATAEYKVNLLRPITIETKTLLARGSVIHQGRRVAVAEATLKDTNNKLYAQASSTCMIIGG